jgi:hypothetical protein
MLIKFGTMDLFMPVVGPRFAAISMRISFTTDGNNSMLRSIP